LKGWEKQLSSVIYTKETKMRYNKEQFEELFRNHYGQMLRMATLLLNDDEEAKDVVSDVFTKLWDGAVDSYAVSSKNFLLICVRNRCIDILSRKKMKDRICQLLTLDSQSAVIPLKDELNELEQLKKVVDTRLTVKDRQVLLMKFENKMKYREIAAALNISEAAVYKHLSQALKTLRNNLTQG
jgi:RNA polymerase sigma factor (sigma-70 family)